MAEKVAGHPADAKRAPADDSLGARTIRDFGEQWHYQGDNEGFYGSPDLLADKLGSLLPLEELRDRRVADIGSGTGRIVRMLLESGARHVLAVEPSRGVELLRANTAEYGDRVEVLHAPGDALPAGLELDFVFSIGVVQFIPEPEPVLVAAREALRPGGRLVVWVYASEASGLYWAALRAVRAVTGRLPRAVLPAVCAGIDRLVDVYAFVSRWLPLPMRDYLHGVYLRVPRAKRRLTIHDQLAPSYYRTYSRDELVALLERCGFADVRIRSCRGYSWTAIGTRPGDGRTAIGTRPGGTSPR